MFKPGDKVKRKLQNQSDHYWISNVPSSESIYTVKSLTSNGLELEEQNPTSGIGFIPDNFELVYSIPLTEIDAIKQIGYAKYYV